MNTAIVKRSASTAALAAAIFLLAACGDSGGGDANTAVSSGGANSGTAAVSPAPAAPAPVAAPPPIAPSLSPALALEAAKDILDAATLVRGYSLFSLFGATASGGELIDAKAVVTVPCRREAGDPVCLGSTVVDSNIPQASNLRRIPANSYYYTTISGLNDRSTNFVTTNSSLNYDFVSDVNTSSPYSGILQIRFSSTTPVFESQQFEYNAQSLRISSVSNPYRVDGTTGVRPLEPTGSRFLSTTSMNFIGWATQATGARTIGSRIVVSDYSQAGRTDTITVMSTAPSQTVYSLTVVTQPGVTPVTRTVTESRSSTRPSTYTAQ